MKVTKKFFKLFGVTIAVLTTTVLIFCIDEVDHEPYFRTEYYAETKARLTNSLATNINESGELLAGLGKAKLTPALNASVEDAAKGEFKSMSLAGYGDRAGRPATGAHDDLFVKAVALKVQGVTGIMFGIDALIVPRNVADAAAARLQQEFGVKREQLYFSATHTHCSIGGWGEGFVGEAFAGEFNPGAVTWFVECIVAAASNAIKDMQPAELGQGVFEAREYVRNRLVGEAGKVDPEFSYLVLKQTNGRLGVLGSYSAHATVLSGKVMEWSADYPGYWQRAVEEATGGEAIFLAGGVGSHAPVPGAKGFEGAERMGGALAQKFLEHLPKVELTNSITFGLLGLDVTLPPFNTRITDDLRLRPWISSRLLPTAKDTFLQGFRLEKTIWISTPCDFSGELALDIKDFMRARGFNAVITSFNGDYIGYVIPRRYYHLSGYEPRIMSFYGPNVPDYLNELIREIAVDLTKN